MPSLLIERTNVYVRNTSPIRQAYTLTVRCGKWSKTVSGSVAPPDVSQTGPGFGKPVFSLDVSPPCNVEDSSLELSSPDEVMRKPEETSASAVPPVSEAEMAQRQRAFEGVAGEPKVSANTPAKEQADSSAFSEMVNDQRFHSLIEKWYRVLDVYKGQVGVAVKPPPYAIGNTGSISRLEVKVINQSPETHRLNFRLSCGDWSRAEQVTIGPMTTYDFGEVTPFGQPLLIYKPSPDCTIYNLEFDFSAKDIQ
jgi:hypothetical protein